MKNVRSIIASAIMTYLSLLSGIGLGTTNDFDRKALLFEPNPNLPLMEDALTLCLRNFWIMSLKMYVSEANSYYYMSSTQTLAKGNGFNGKQMPMSSTVSWRNRVPKCGALN
nr:unnamed protein product [Callosobruchus chinensis]